MNKKLKWVVAAAMLATFVAMYLAVYRYVIIFHEQHHLFRFSADYVSHLSHWKGAWAVCEAFLAQFGYYPWLAAVIWSLLLVAVYLLTQSAIRRLTGLTDLLQLSAIVPVMVFFKSVDIDGSLQPVAWALCGAIGFWIVAAAAGHFVRKPIAKGVAFRPWFYAGAPLIFVGLFAGFYYNSFKAETVTMPNGKERTFTREQVKIRKLNEKLMMMTIQATRRGDWDEVVELVNRQVETGTRNHLMSYLRAMALANRGELPDRLFDTPQHHGAKSIFFPWEADRNQAEYGGFIFEQLGLLNSALHWEFEAMVGWGETAHHLINLSRYLIATGKPQQARKFIHPLKQTLFYRSTARELEKWAAEGSVPGLKNSGAHIPSDPDRYDNVKNIAGDCHFLLVYEPDNVMARDYLLLTLMLANNLGDFYNSLLQFYPPDGKPLPKAYQEALCLVRLNYGPERIAADGYSISPEVQANFRAFNASINGGKFSQVPPELQRTYWYYVTKLSPQGNTLNF